MTNFFSSLPASQEVSFLTTPARLVTAGGNHLDFAVSVASGIVSLLILKGIVEPAATYWGGRLGRKYLPGLFDLLEPFIPGSIRSNTVKDVVLNGILRLEERNGETLTESQRASLIKEFLDVYDPEVAAQKLGLLKNVQELGEV